MTIMAGSYSNIMRLHNENKRTPTKLFSPAGKKAKPKFPVRETAERKAKLQHLLQDKETFFFHKFHKIFKDHTLFYLKIEHTMKNDGTG